MYLMYKSIFIYYYSLTHFLFVTKKHDIFFSEFKIQEISSTQFFGQAPTLEERTFSRGYTQASQSMLVCGYLLKLVQVGP